MKKQIKRPTESELEILSILWSKGTCTVKEVYDEIAKTKETGYTTTLKLMQIMFEKGLVKREKSGKMHRYSPVLTAERTQSQLLDKLMDTAFGGSAMKLVMQALGNKKTTKSEIKELKDYLDKIEKGIK